jgi:hypothetical protein
MQIEERTVAAGTGKRSEEGSEEVAGRGIALATLDPFGATVEGEPPSVWRFIFFFDDYNPF